MEVEVKPYKEQEGTKKEQVATMFNNISARYDFLNHFLSLGIDTLWRKKAIKLLSKHQPTSVLDIATGTGDFAIEALKLNPEKIVGVDISEGMMAMGREKLKKRNLDQKITLLYGDSEELPFGNESFDAITVGFGVRNFQNLEQGLSEMKRVLTTNGTAVILEFSKPKNFPIKHVFGFYSNYFIPFFGKLISKDKAAYTYLPESVAAFPEGDDFLNIMQKVGFTNTFRKPLTGGIATIYIGKK
ncbi:MAG: bifunctional demethylmenaquinone methyltransferase/2-methoxy-6-polyprenyl-1,4-benzoquinol methylase UbiE [Bacteroidia bacterium]